MPGTPTVLVSGAAGQFGRLAVDHLIAHGGATIVAGTRDPQKLAGVAAKGVEVRRFDWEDEASLATVFTGVDRVLLISGELENRSANQIRAVNAAAKAGVEFIAYTSMLTPERYQHIPIAPSHLATEQAIKASGMAYAILQNMWYPDGLIDTLRRALASGRWDTSAGDGKVAYVSREDCARAAAAVLAASEPPTGTFAITGSEALSAVDIAALATQLTGKPIEVHTLTDDQAAAGLRAAQLPEVVVDLIVGIDRLNREGGASQVSDAVERLTGSKPQGVSDFLRAHADALWA